MTAEDTANVISPAGENIWTLSNFQCGGFFDGIFAYRTYWEAIFLPRHNWKLVNHWL